TYTVTANGLASNVATAIVQIAPVDDIAVVGAQSASVLLEDVSALVVIPYVDVDADLATACELRALSNLSEIAACSCDGSGVCRAELQGSPLHFNGPASLEARVVSA